MRPHRWQEAIATCEQALSPTLNVSAFQPVAQRIGTLLQSAGRFDDAVLWHTLAQTPDPNLADIYTGLGRVYLQQEQPEQAIAAYQTVLRHNPDCAEACWTLASIYFQRDQRQTALQYWTQALAIEPQKATPEGHVRFGQAMAKFGQHQDALNCYRRAIYVDPDYVPAYRALAQAFLQQGRREDAVAIYREAITRVSQPGALYHDLGHIFQDQAQMDVAMATFQQAIEQDPDYPWNHHDWVQLLIQEERWDEVIAASVATIERDPQSPWAYTQMGRALMATGKTEEAIAYNQSACVLRGWSQCQTHGYRFSQDWFSHNIPIWLDYLQSLQGKAHMKAIEIGSYQGMSTCWLLDHVLTHPTAQIICVDCHFQPEFDANIAKTGSAHKVSKRVGVSAQMVPPLPLNQFDLVYVDGGHQADIVREDGIRGWHKLKPGGILIFDDYYWSDPAYPDQDPKRGIDDVLTRFRDSVTILYHDYQVIVQKKVLPRPHLSIPQSAPLSPQASAP